jgi:DNA repair protein RecN (Recombination protein N)
LVTIGTAAGDDALATLVFDEVDSGIGGIAATAVGDALASVAKSHQVLVVTHLAQVAAVADAQIAVTKSVVADETVAGAEVIEGERRVTEVARMLSGDAGGAAAHRHARELLHP